VVGGAGGQSCDSVSLVKRPARPGDGHIEMSSPANRSLEAF